MINTLAAHSPAARRALIDACDELAAVLTILARRGRELRAGVSGADDPGRDVEAADKPGEAQEDKNGG